MVDEAQRKKTKFKKKKLGQGLTEKELELLLEAEKEFFDDPKNKRKKWDPDDPEFHKRAKGGIVKRYKGGLMVKPKAAKRGY